MIKASSYEIMFHLANVQELLTIATCEMKEEDTKIQVLFWELACRRRIQGKNKVI